LACIGSVLINTKGPKEQTLIWQAKKTALDPRVIELEQKQQQQQQHSLFSQASWGRLEMKPERN